MVTVPEGPVSTDTMRAEDLIPRFLDVLEYGEADIINLLREFDLPSDFMNRGYEPVDDGEIECSTNLLNALFDELSDMAPPGYYFGAVEGDGACYGFWKVEDEDEDEDEEA